MSVCLPEEPLNVCQLISLVGESRQLTRAEIVVSVMGCLSGSQSVCFQWSESEQHFSVSTGISCAQDLNERVLHNYLNHYCKYGTAFKLMFDFCYNEVKNEELIICFTFNAFRSSLRHLLIDYIKQLNSITDYLIHCNRKEVMISLLGFKYWLDSDQNRNLLLRIEILWQIFERIRRTAFAKNTNHSLSFAILNAIYERIEFQKNSIRSIVYKLFIDCLKPTLDYFDYILTNGLIRDSHQEFIFIESNEDLNSINFWNNCLKIRSDLNEMPVFLSKHLDLILIAAKSRLMSRKLSFISETKFNKTIDLFNNFSNALNDLLRKSDCFANKNSINESIECIEQSVNVNRNPSSDQIIPKSLAMSSSEKTEYDSDLNHFDVYALHSYHYYDYAISFDELVDRNDLSDYYLPLKTVKPIELIVNEALTQTIGRICSDISSQLIDLIIIEYKKYLKDFCDYYLMRSSRVIPKYCSELFENIKAMNSSKIDNLYALENETTFASVPNIKPFISYNELSSEPIEFFNNVHLIYSNIEWPFTIVFNSQVIGLLNKVFQLLLKVKYSQWLLDRLMFTRQFRSSFKTNRFINVMRFRLQNSINKLYNHLMTEIDVHINQVLNRCDRLTNFEELNEIHNKFIVQLKQTIFLRQQTLRNVVKKLIKLCSDLELIWNSQQNRGDEHLDSHLKNIDLDISRCNHLLDCFYEVSNQLN